MKNSTFFFLSALCLSFSLKAQIILQEAPALANLYLSQQAESASLITITRAEIDHMPVQTINEILEYSVGLDVRQRGPLDVQADLSLRGSTFDQVLVLLNGHPMNDPQTGHHNMNLPVSIDEIETIEILHGGASLRYGPYAFAGAINFITRSTLKPNRTTAEAQFGSFGYYQLKAGIQRKFGNHGVSLHASTSHSDGYIENTDFDQLQVRLQSDHLFPNSKLGSLRFEAGFITKDFGAQNFYTTSFPTQFEATQTFFTGLQWSSNPNESNWTFNSRINFRRHWDRFELFRETGGPYRYSDGFFINGNDTVASWYSGHNYHRTDVLGGDFYMSNTNALGRTEMGVDMRYESILSNALGEELNEAIAVDSEGRAFYLRGENRTNSGAFLRHTIPFSQTGIVKAGLRYNYNTQFDAAFLPSLEVSMALPTHPEWRAYTSYNRAFRLPTYTDLYYRLGGAQGSKNLQPEYSNNYELGGKYRSADGTSNLQISLFRREGKNLIDWIVLPDDSSQTLQAANITELNLNGLEFDYRKNNPSPSTQAHWTQIGISFSPIIQDQGEFDFESLYSLDYLQMKVSADVRWSLGYHLHLSLRYLFQQRNGSFLIPGSAIPQAFESIHTIDARLDWTRKSLLVYLDGNNLLDRMYVDRASVLQPGIWVRTGIRYRI